MPPSPPPPPAVPLSALYRTNPHRSNTGDFVLFEPETSTATREHASQGVGSRATELREEPRFKSHFLPMAGSHTTPRIWANEHDHAANTKMDSDGGGIEIFLQDYEDSGLKDEVKELETFVSSVTLKDLEREVEPAGLNNNAWLDERSISGEKRDHKNPFTARQIYRERQVPVSRACIFYVLMMPKTDEATIANWSRRR
jgi:hypothetical protein